MEEGAGAGGRRPSFRIMGQTESLAGGQSMEEGAGAGGGRLGPHGRHFAGAGGGGATKETKSLSSDFGMGSGLSMKLMSMGVPLGVALGDHTDKEPYPGCFKGVCKCVSMHKHVHTKQTHLFVVYA